MGFGDKKVRQVKLPENLSEGTSEYEAVVQMAIDFCVRSLSFKDQSRLALGAKLSARGYPDRIAARALDYMEECRYLDDPRLARAVAEQNILSGRGSAAVVRMKLKRMGIDRAVADEAVEECSGRANQPLIIAETIRRKFPQFVPDGADRRLSDRVMRYFLSRGYSYGQLKDACSLLREGYLDE